MLVNRLSGSMKCCFRRSNLRCLFLFCALTLATVSFLGCAHRKSQAAKTPVVPRFVGRIELVSANFVLIDTGSSGWSGESGVAVVTRDLDGKQTAQLKITQERKGSFVSADIVSGKPNHGDKVYQ